VHSAPQVNVEAELLGASLKALQEEVEARLQLALMMAPAAPDESAPARPSAFASPRARSQPSLPRVSENDNCEAAAPSASHAPAHEATPLELQASVLAMQHLWALCCQLADVTLQRNQLLAELPTTHVAVR